MFDPITAALIGSAPPLEGLDLQNLPKLLTEAFADIVSARIRLRGSAQDEDNPGLTETLRNLRRLAATHEAYVALLPDRDNSTAAAFVAASPHEAFLHGREWRAQYRHPVGGRPGLHALLGR